MFSSRDPVAYDEATSYFYDKSYQNDVYTSRVDDVSSGNDSRYVGGNRLMDRLDNNSLHKDGVYEKGGSRYGGRNSGGDSSSAASDDYYNGFRHGPGSPRRGDYSRPGENYHRGGANCRNEDDYYNHYEENDYPADDPHLSSNSNLRSCGSESFSYQPANRYCHHHHFHKIKFRKSRDPSEAGSAMPEHRISQNNAPDPENYHPEITMNSAANNGRIEVADGSDRDGGAISTMSASAITLETHSTWDTTKRSSSRGECRSRGTRSRTRASSRNAMYLKTGDCGETGSRYDVIPIQVSFQKKENVVISNFPKGGTLNTEGSRGNGNIMNDKRSHASFEKEISFNDKDREYRGRKDCRFMDDTKAKNSLTFKPPAPLRRPEAVKSSETMRRGKSTRSLDSAPSRGSRRSRNRSKSGDPKGRHEGRENFDDRSRNRSRDPNNNWRGSKRGQGSRRLARNDDDREDNGRRLCLPRGRTTRKLNSAEMDQRYYKRGQSWHQGSHNRQQHIRGDTFYNAHLISDTLSVESQGSWCSVRCDIDAEGYCMHHPNIHLMKLRKDGNWRVIRKKCPECIVEDCPSMISNIQRGSSSDVYHNGSSPNFNSSAASSSLGAFHDLGLSLQTPEEMEEAEATNRLKRRLAARAYHFPGNTWCQDWMQYLSNTHTVLGLFFHHPLHPMGFQERLVILFGSIAIGLTISNFTYLYFIKNGIDVEEEVFTLNSRHTDYTGIPVVSVTKLMITLWTLGSFIHTVFDLGLWHMKACTLCRYQGGVVDGRLVRWGRVAGLFIVMIAMGAGGYAVLLRASIEYKGEGSVADEVEDSIINNEIYSIEFEDKRSFRFLLGYLIEFVLALFVYYPIAVTVLFSGVLGCGGRVPILGGRPREMKKESRYEMSKRQPRILKVVNIEGEESNDSFAGDASTMDVCTKTSCRDYESGSHFGKDQII